MPGGGGQERGRRPWIPGARPGEDPREIGERLRASGVLPGGGGSRVAEEAGRSPGSAGLGVGEEERGGPCDVSRSELQEPRQGPGGAERDPEIGSGREPQHLERRRRRRRRLGLARPAIGTSAHSGPQAPARAQSLPGPSMARAAALRPSRSLPVPTLPLLPLFLMLLREAGAQDVEVRVPPEVQGRLGSTVELPCHLLSPTSDVRVRVSQVMWMRQVTSKTSQNLAIFHPTYGPSFPSSKPGQERLWFVMAGQKAGSGPGPAAPEQWEPELRDATLALSGLTVEDEGNYTCEFATFPWGTSRGVTWLRAIAEPRNHAEKQEVTLSLDPLPVARCVSTGGRPPARITWLSTLDGDSTESQTAGPEPGTFTVTSRFTVVPLGRVDGATVTCKVEHESFEEPALLPVTLSVRYPPEVSISGYDDNWYIGRAEASLHCDVRSNPEPTGYDWSTVSGVFPASALARGSQLIIHSVDRLVNTTFICTVTNAVGTGRAELPVLVRAILSSAEWLLLALHSEITPGRLKRPHGMPGIKPGSIPGHLRPRQMPYYCAITPTWRRTFSTLYYLPPVNS